MSVHYKFKSALDFDTITFDGLHISVADLKKSIIQQKRLGKTADFDLQITNAQTKEEYVDNGTLIPKNTSLIIARIPLSAHTKKSWDPQADKVQHHRSMPEPERGDLDITQMNGSEEDKIQAMMAQSTVDYDPNKYQKIRGQSQTGEVPATYRCFKCHKPGHWIKNCPMNVILESVEPAKRSTGIPRSFLQDKESQEKLEEIPQPVVEKKQEIPDDLICSICKDLFTDAVMIPCCGSSFCDECVRTALLESEDNECPDCNEKGSSPGSLIPNRFLRNSVNSFKNETGYTKPKPVKEKPKEPVIVQVVAEPPIQKPLVPEIQNEVSNNNNIQKIQISAKKLSPPEKHVPEKIVVVVEKPEHTDKKHDPHSSHDEIESDYEDNITVTLPPAHLQSHRPSYHERPFNGTRLARNPRPPGMENSPKYNQMSPGRDIENSYHQTEEMSGQDNNSEMTHQSHIQPLSRDSSMRQQQRPLDNYGHMQPQMNPYGPNMQGGMPPHPNQMRGYDNNYGMHHPGYMPSYPLRAPFPGGNRMGYGGQMQMIRPRHMLPPNNLASVYQGVQAKVGPGIIDDPLEAFNRIMREKEQRKEERRRSPERRRSRSIENRRLRSSPLQHFQRQRVDNRRMRSPFMIRDRRGRSRNRDKRINEMEKRRHRSSSFSDRSSRSRSWSNPPPMKRRSKTPINIRRRTRSRTPSYSASRSRSRSHSKGRFRGPPVIHGRYNRSPLKSISPKYRQKETRPRREEFRENSPYHSQRRPRSRIRSPHNRQDKPMGYDHFNYQNPSPPTHEIGFRNPPGKRYSRDRQDNFIRNDRNEHYEINRESEYKPHGKFEDAPSETIEPPIPGFESSPLPPEQSWEYPFDEHDNYGRGDRFEDKDLHISNSNLRQFHDDHPRGERSWSKTSMHSSVAMAEKRRRSRSRTPPRLEQSSENNLRKEKIKDRFDHHETKRIDNKKYEKSSLDRSKERKFHESAKEKSKDYCSGRTSEKDVKSSIKEKEKEKEKDKKSNEKEKEKEKEKRIENSDEDKKDKKLKDRKKKKKDKEEKELKKKIKKDKKDKEKKEKLKLKNKDGEEEEEEKLENNEQLRTENDLTSTLKSVDNGDADIPQNSNSLSENHNLEFEQIEPIKCPEEHNSNTLDLYGDICQAEDIKFDYMNISAEDGEIVEETEDPNNKQFNRFDSILDIHDFETTTDIDGLNTTNEPPKPQVLAELPEPSKWEIDDDGSIRDDKKNIESGYEVNDEGKVTSEVLKRAESAIFSRAINAIRPIEIKKVSVERQKLYSGKEMMEMTPPKEERPTFQVTVPINNNLTSTRSVEIKDEKKLIKDIKEEKKSIKDRLGVKINDPEYNNFNQDRSLTPPPHKYTVSEEHRKPKRSRSKEKYSDKKEEIREKIKNIKPFDDYNKRSKIRDFRTDKPINRYRESDRNKSPIRFSRDHFRDRRSRERDRIDRDRNLTEAIRNRDIRINRNFDKKQDRTRSISIDKKRIKQHDKIEKITYDIINKDLMEKSSEPKKKISEAMVIKKDKHSSVNESTTTSTNSGSDSDSDDNKKKKRKHKKEKKHSRRSSSIETKSSGKRKRSKSKKKNKTSKKKKKTKK